MAQTSVFKIVCVECDHEFESESKECFCPNCGMWYRVEWPFKLEGSSV